MRALDRLLLNGGGGSVGKGKDDEATSAAPPRPAAGADDSLSFYGKDGASLWRPDVLLASGMELMCLAPHGSSGHLNFWASEEMRPVRCLPSPPSPLHPADLPFAPRHSRTTCPTRRPRRRPRSSRRTTRTRCI